MRRTNSFAIVFTHPERVIQLAVGCVVLWNKLNFKRRQSFFKGNLDWDSKAEYDEFKGWVGSATAQQIIRKNDASWRGFFRLLKAKREGRLPPHIKQVSPPGYWKDRRTGKYRLRIIIRRDCYRIDGRNITLPKRITGRMKGAPRWLHGKQGTLELRYDESRRCWYAYQSIVVTEPLLQPCGRNRAFVDFGVLYPLTAIIEGVNRPIAYSGAPLLSDWWYLTNKIAEYQHLLKVVNGKHSSARLSRLYRIRRRRFRQEINSYVSHFVKFCHTNGVDTIIAGELTGIRANTQGWNTKSSAMVNNFWSHKYLADRLIWTAENYGIKVLLIDERGSSSHCPWCNSQNVIRRGRLFKCLDCRREAHRDVVGSLNIGLVHGSKQFREGDSNRVMAHPEVIFAFSKITSKASPIL
ncbi:MAG: RNA-guided endonuclease TnpB family protein [Promethearchaeota archaeon]